MKNQDSIHTHDWWWWCFRYCNLSFSHRHSNITYYTHFVFVLWWWLLFVLFCQKLFCSYYILFPKILEDSHINKVYRGCKMSQWKKGECNLEQRPHSRTQQPHLYSLPKIENLLMVKANPLPRFPQHAIQVSNPWGSGLSLCLSMYLHGEKNSPILLKMKRGDRKLESNENEDLPAGHLQFILNLPRTLVSDHRYETLFLFQLLQLNST